MIVVHIESGLGNQMLSYCEYLALKYSNPHQEFYIETIVHEIPECNDYICQWNGYELDRIFSIDKPKNIKSLFSAEEWSEIISEIRESEFWIHNWNYPVVFTRVLNKHGLNLINERGDFDPGNNIITGQSPKPTLLRKLKDSRLGYWCKRNMYRLFEKHHLALTDRSEQIFSSKEKDIFTGQWLCLKYRQNKRELIDQQIKSCFQFPELDDSKSKELLSYLKRVNAVAIHARRGDMLSGLEWCYKYGYFKRAVNYIKKHVANPVFVFFTNPGSIEWCKDNADVFGLQPQKDEILFVDWNKGDESYRDIQMMSYCKHAIITTSTFGWWGAYFIDYKDKITISPDISIDTTHHC